MSLPRAAPTPAERVRPANEAPVHGDRQFVLYWMTAHRRLRTNFALQRAAEQAAALSRPLVILEALRLDYPWASERLHAFVLGGMREHQAALAATRVRYYPYVEPRVGAGRGLLETLAVRACLVVTDDYPAFFIPPLVTAAAKRLDARLEAVDSNGLRPIRRGDRVYPSAYLFRRALQWEMLDLLEVFPEPDPLAGRTLPPLPLDALAEVERRWPPTHLGALDLSSLPIDHEVPAAPTAGGAAAGLARLDTFLGATLGRYADARNQPDEDATSGLSPYLHFGHVGAHEVVAALLEREDWSPAGVADRPTGRREGWWGLGASSEAFLDQVVTWRELGFNFAAHHPDDGAQYESLPGWARATLDAHADDPREHAYTPEDLAEARTHDPLWNAAQRQLLREGRIHNYLRMLWGKKILEWSPLPRDALAAMLALNDRYALDGRDPNSISGICWVLGRYDRPWGPERPVFGTVRYMSSANTARKLRVREYLQRYGSTEG